MVTVQTSRDLIHANRFYTAINRPADMQLFLDRIIGKQSGTFARQRAPYLVKKRLKSCPLEIGTSLLRNRI
jgi:hypothetical protein